MKVESTGSRTTEQQLLERRKSWNKEQRKMSILNIIVGKRGVLHLALWASIFLFMLGIILGGISGCEQFGEHIFAAFKISYPAKSTGWGIVGYFVLGVFALCLAPILTAGLTKTIDAQINVVLRGRKIYRHICDHFVIIGYNRYATQILKQLLADNKSYAIIMTTRNPIEIREALSNELDKDIVKRVVIYAGDALLKEMVAKLNLCYSKKLYLLDESDKHCSQYTRNLSVLKNIVDESANRSVPLEVYMQVNNSLAYNLLQRVDIPNDFFKRNGVNVIDFRPFNIYENWARLLWSFHVLKDADNNPIYEPLDFEPLEDTNKHVHLVISNFNSMGRALLLEALRLCHYPNFNEQAKKNKTIITIFDSKWQEKEGIFFAQYPKDRLEQITDIGIDFQNMDINSLSARTQIEKWSQDTNKLLTIAICDKEADIAMTNSLNLPEKVLMSNTRILVRQEIEKVTYDIFFHDDQRIYPHLKFFGMLKEGLDVKQLNDRLAMCIGGIYSFYQGETFNLSDAKKILDCQEKIQETLAQKDEAAWYEGWLNTIQTDKWSNRFQSDMFNTYIALWERHKNISSTEFTHWQEILAEMEHRRWIAERTVYGFRKTIGKETKDKVLKIHPNIVPYADLDEETKNYDRNVVNTASLLVQEMEKMGN